MTTNDFKLVTIICEPVLSSSVIKLIRAQGASGFTASQVRGEGTGTKSSGEIPDEKTKIEIVVSEVIATKIMTEIAKTFFENYSLITYSSDITVLRPDKFVK